MASDSRLLISIFLEIPKETLDKITIDPDTLKHYQQENEIKRLLIERETYKRAYEEQQQNIQEVVNEVDNIMSRPVEIENKSYQDSFGIKHTSTHIVTLREYAKRKCNYNLPEYKILNDIHYDKSFKFY